MIKLKNHFFNSSILKKILIFLLCFLFSSALFLPTAFASGVSYEDAHGNWYYESEIPNSIGQTAFRWVVSIFDTKMLTSVTSVLSVDLNNNAVNGGYLEVWTIINNIYSAISLIGISFCALYFLMGLLDKAQTESFNMEQLFKALIKFSVTILFIQNGMTFVQYGFEFGNALVTTVQNSGNISGATDDLVVSYHTTLKSYDKSFRGSLSCLSILLDLLFPYLGMYVARIIVFVLAYSRIFELFLRAAFFPIGIAEMFNGSNNASGLRYIKKFFATALQGALIIAILIIYGALANAVAGGVSGSVQVLIVTFAVISLMMKSQTWASEILGV